MKMLTIFVLSTQAFLYLLVAFIAWDAWWLPSLGELDVPARTGILMLWLVSLAVPIGFVSLHGG